MSNIKTVLRVGGVALAAIGGLCFPVGLNVFQRGDLSKFHNIADTGVFVPIGLTLLAVGLISFGLSFVVRGEMGD